MTTSIDHPADLKSLIGQPLGHSDWFTIDQHRIDAFADATNDHQWIHTNPEQAKHGPYGTTIAHGYLTLALLIPLWTEILTINNITTSINYGLNKVRFTGPVPTGAKIRATATLIAADDIDNNGIQATIDFTIETDGTEKPCLIAQAIHRYYP